MIDVNTDAIIRQTTRQKPAAYRQCGGGVRDEKGAMARQTTVKTLPRTVSVAGGGETKKGELKENTGANSQSQNPPAGYHRGGEGQDKRRKPTRNGKVAQPTFPRGGEVP